MGTPAIDLDHDPLCAEQDVHHADEAHVVEHLLAGGPPGEAASAQDLVEQILGRAHGAGPHDAGETQE